jgi:hypothetical protein
MNANYITIRQMCRLDETISAERSVVLALPTWIEIPKEQAAVELMNQLNPPWSLYKLGAPQRICLGTLGQPNLVSNPRDFKTEVKQGNGGGNITHTVQVVPGVN